MDHVLSLQCLICGAEYAPDELLYVCPRHGDEGILDVRYDYELIGRRVDPQRLARDPDPSIWRYLDLLPVDGERFRRWRVSLGGPALAYPIFNVGGTPLYAPPVLREQLAMPRLWVKDDGRLPSGSLKDRASAVGVINSPCYSHRLGKSLALAHVQTGIPIGTVLNVASETFEATATIVPSPIYDPQKARTHA